MVGKPDDSRRKIEKGRQDVADTSSAITEKLATLEHRVQESVDAVKHGVDFHYQVKQRPWLMVGGSLLVGYALGRRRGRSSTTTETSRVPSARAQTPQNVASQATSQVQDHLATSKGLPWQRSQVRCGPWANRFCCQRPDKSMMLSPRQGSNASIVQRLTARNRERRNGLRIHLAQFAKNR